MLCVPHTPPHTGKGTYPNRVGMLACLSDPRRSDVPLTGAAIMNSPPAKKNRIPTKVPLAPDVTIMIRRAEPEILAGIIEEGVAGVWDWKNRTVWLDRTMGLTEQWKALRHELQHALIDIHEELHGGIGHEGHTTGLATASVPERPQGVSADAPADGETPQRQEP